MRTCIRVTLSGEDAIVYGRALWPVLLLALLRLVVIRNASIADVNDPEYRVETSSPWLVIPATAIETVTKDVDNGAA